MSSCLSYRWADQLGGLTLTVEPFASVHPHARRSSQATGWHRALLGQGSSSAGA